MKKADKWKLEEKILDGKEPKRNQQKPQLIRNATRNEKNKIAVEMWEKRKYKNEKYDEAKNKRYFIKNCYTFAI